MSNATRVLPLQKRFDDVANSTIKVHGKKEFDWHGDRITTNTAVTKTYRHTQNVRRFLTETCGSYFKFDRQFMAWIQDGKSKTMGDVAQEWMRRQQKL